jgi:hypothetical protein
MIVRMYVSSFFVRRAASTSRTYVMVETPPLVGTPVGATKAVLGGWGCVSLASHTPPSLHERRRTT